MCRIAGIASKFLPLEQLRQTVGDMCYVLRHGGPDDEGIYSTREHGLVLGHRRLSLLDLNATGHQPMHYGEQRYTLTYNGEIYNYQELKKELSVLGYRFASTTDTEVILAAFAAWGTDSFSRLNGMFAFALFDSWQGILYLVRDLLGIKPLYYFRSHELFAFASETRAFHCLPAPPDERPDWPVYLMAYGHLPEPVTTMKDVKPLPKGSFLRYNLRSGEMTTLSYDSLSFFEKDISREEARQEVSALLRAAVKRHLVADASIGVFLSGGVDSSIIAQIAGETADKKLQTLSIHFREPAYSEQPYQQKIANQLSSAHFQYQLEKEEFHFHLPDILTTMDLPSSDGINTWFISRSAAKLGLKAVLSGLGGDELFGGYPSFRRIKTTTLLQQVSGPALRSFNYLKDKKLRRLAYLSLPGLTGQYLFLRGQFSPFGIARHLDIDESEVWRLLEKEPALPDYHHLTPENRASWMELNLYMQNQLLRDTDVMSMAHGVEIRVPMLDKTFVKLALRIQSSVKYSGPASKGLLIEAFHDTLPREVWDRKKMGFSFPFAEWIKDDEWIRSRMMSGSRSCMNLMHQFDRGGLHWSGLMTALLIRTKQPYANQHSFSNA